MCCPLVRPRALSALAATHRRCLRSKLVIKTAIWPKIAALGRRKHKGRSVTRQA